MHHRKLGMLKNYTKIIKCKKRNGEVEEVKVQLEPEEKHQEQAQIHPDLKNEDFEDPVDDEYEDQEEWISQGQDEEEQMEEEVNQSGTMMSEPKPKRQRPQQMKEEQAKKQLYLGNNKNLSKGEVLEFDNKAYDMLHRLNIEWPSMSIDFVAKSSPFDPALTSYQPMVQYPFEIFTVQGSCNNSNKNSIYLTKWSNLCQTKYDDDPEAEDDDPEVVVQEIETTFDVSRIRALNNSPVVAFWNDNGHTGEVRIMDLSANYQKLRQNVGSKRREKGKQIIIPCEAAGYGLAWNPHKVGQLIIGDNQGRVSVLANNSSYSQWSTSQTYTYHQGSVEDIVFSPNQQFVFATCSSDGTLQVVDMRVGNPKKAQICIKAHNRDVNVCDWNKIASHLLVTGSDDSSVKVWDLRLVSEGAEEQLLTFSWHTQPITSIKFQPNEQSVVAVASEDNRLSIWDMSMQNQEADPEIPNELMFLHQGQQEIKQISYHPVYFEMLVSTSLDAVNIFKPAFEMPEEDLDQRADKEDLKRPPIHEQDLDKYLQRMSLQ